MPARETTTFSKSLAGTNKKSSTRDVVVVGRAEIHPRFLDLARRHVLETRMAEAGLGNQH